MPRRALVVACAFVVAACGGDDTANSGDAATAGGGDATVDSSPVDARALEATTDAGEASAPPPPCVTRVSYGSAWIHPANHPAAFDDAAGLVTWDGTCVDDGPSSYALLSNGFKPYFGGHSACVLALDSSASCGAPAACATRVTYGTGWLPPPAHPASFDDVAGRVYGDGVCVGGSYTNLSNGWQPHFGGGACALSLRYTQCGGLYENPVIPVDCPDPGVLRDGKGYVLTCTSGNAADAFPLYTSSDLASWTLVGHALPMSARPSWAASDFWAPEIHKVGAHYVLYFTVRHKDGVLSIGAAQGPSATGPFTDLGAPLLHDPAMGLIDPSELTSAAQTPYLLWKEDGNAKGKPTPIHAQQLAPDGLSLVGNRATLVTNDLPWEGAVTEAPFMVERGGAFYLFYSGGSYADATYAVGVAKGSSPLGPMTKLGAPILTTTGPWVGPGHCAVVDTGAGETAMVFHAWKAGCVNGPFCGRETLLDRVEWASGWPSVPLSPSSNSRPIP